LAVYVHHSKKGPDFAWDQANIAVRLADIRFRQGRLLGVVDGMAVGLREEAWRHVHSLDVMAFGGATGGLFADLLMEAAQEHTVLLTRERLFRWHAALFTAPGKAGHAVPGKIHFQTAAGEGSEGKLTKLIHWVNFAADIDPVVKAGVAQLWLLQARPFEQGNERLGELVMEWVMARANQGGERLYSVSGQMMAEGREYDAILGKMRHPQQDATAWIEWFLDCVGRALDSADEALEVFVRKDRFWERCAGMGLNDRQRLMLANILDSGDDKLTSSRWAALTGASQDTAGRDINDLVRRGILQKTGGGGRSTSYGINA
jgi:Fic family protein